MSSMKLLICTLLAASLLAWPPTALMQAPKPPAFEVAAINPATMPTAEAILSGNARIGFNITDSRVEIGLVSIADLLPRAFRVQPYQISGPPWMSEQRFDIRATFPPGSSKAQVPEMLQALLTERFGLVTHKESRDMSVYALVVGKGGPKLAAPEELPEQKELAPGEVSLNTGESQVRITKGPGNTMSMVMRNEQTGPVRMTVDPASTTTMQMELLQVSMKGLAELLSPMTGRPVLDFTGLTGTYRAPLALSLADLLQAAQAAGLGTMPGAGGNLGGAPAPAATASDPSGTSIRQAVQKLGLDLDSRRAPVEVIVVDKVERNPTAN